VTTTTGTGTSFVLGSSATNVVIPLAHSVDDLPCELPDVVRVRSHRQATLPGVVEHVLKMFKRRISIALLRWGSSGVRHRPQSMPLPGDYGLDAIRAIKEATR
jgi:hypothetical protein